jgi:hypothetical protein
MKGGVCSLSEKKEEVGIAGFLRTKERWGFSFDIHCRPNTRKSPEISTALVAEAVAVGAALGVPSVRQLDQLLQREGVRRGLGSRRARVASDSTVSAVCDVMKTSEVRRRLREAWRSARREGLLGMEVGGLRRRVGVVDGTFMGGQWMSVMYEIGEIPVPVSAVRYPKRGKELAASQALLRHLKRIEGRGCFELALFDGLYANEPNWAVCEELGAAAVVKVNAEEADRLLILKDARGLFDAPKRLPGVEYAEGLDERRGCRYEVWAAAGLEWSGTERTLKVVRVRERWLKGPYKGQTLEFWVISQDQELDALALREIAHLRWFIENNGFKALNEQAHTKHVFRRRSAGALNMSLLQMMGRTWLELYRHELRAFKEQMKHLWDHGTFPLRLLRVYLWMSLGGATADTS